MAQRFGGRLPTLPLPTALLGATGSASGGFGVAAETFRELPSAFGRRPCRSPLRPKGSEDPAEDGSLAEVLQQRLDGFQGLLMISMYWESTMRASEVRKKASLMQEWS